MEITRRCLYCALIASLLFMASSLPAPASQAEQRKSRVEVNGLNCEFRVTKPRIRTAQEFEAQAVFMNKSGKTLRLNALFLHIPQVLIKVRRIDGTPIHPSLPPFPPEDDGKTGRIVLEPGQSTAFSYKGSDYFGTSLAPGKYQARYIYENIAGASEEWTGKIETDWVNFEVVR